MSGDLPRKSGKIRRPYLVSPVSLLRTSWLGLENNRRKKAPISRGTRKRLIASSQLLVFDVQGPANSEQKLKNSSVQAGCRLALDQRVSVDCGSLAGLTGVLVGIRGDRCLINAAAVKALPREAPALVK